MASKIVKTDTSGQWNGYNTIQEAITASTNNSTIYVHVGAYTENIDFTTKTNIIVYLLPGATHIGTITNKGTTNNIIYANGRRYIASLSQNGTGNISGEIKLNTLGCTITWSRTSAGVYVGTFSTPIYTSVRNIERMYNKINRVNFPRIDNSVSILMTYSGSPTTDEVSNITLYCGTTLPDSETATLVDLSGFIYLDFEIL